MTYDYTTGTPSTTDRAASAAQTARDEASGVAQSAKETGLNLVGEATSQAKDVAAEAGRQAKDLLHQGKSQLSTQAAEQQRRLTGGLRTFGSELGQMADGSQQRGVATSIARTVADQTDAIASWLDAREPAELIEELKEFARRRPGTFLAVAAGVGLLAGRLTRSLRDAPDTPQLAAGYGSGAHRAPGAATTPATLGSYDTGTTSTYGSTGSYGTTGESSTYGTTGAYATTTPGTATTTYGGTTYGTPDAAGTTGETGYGSTSGGYGQTGYGQSSGSSDDTAVYSTTETGDGTGGVGGATTVSPTPGYADDAIGTAVGDPVAGVEREEDR